MPQKSFIASIFDFIKLLIKLAIFVVVVFGGWNLYRALNGEGYAKIREMAFGGAGDYPKCWVTMEFKKIPPGVDPTDIKIVFTSKTLVSSPVTFDWNFIAANAQVGTGDWKPRVKAEGFSPGEPPKLNLPVDVYFPMTYQDKVNLGSNLEFLSVQAELYWGGKKQDTANATIEHFYKTTGR